MNNQVKEKTASEIIQKLLDAGMAYADIALGVGVVKRTVIRWHKDVIEPKRKSDIKALNKMLDLLT